MKVRLTKQEVKYIQEVSPYTDLVPGEENLKEMGNVLELGKRELQELNDFIAAEANHTDSKTAERVLDGLFFKIDKILEYGEEP